MDESLLHSPVMKPASVALIEDHALVRQLLGKVLASDPSVSLVGEFANVAEGTAGLLRLRPALAIVDWMLPDGRGIDVVHAVASQSPRTRFLFLSSVEKSHVVRESIEAGVHGFVMKRASYETLAEAIRTVIADRSYYCPTSSKLLVESLRTSAASPRLTPRERDILRGVARGHSAKELATHLGLSPKTVNNQLSSLKEKLGIYDAAGLVRFAGEHGLGEAL